MTPPGPTGQPVTAERGRRERTRATVLEVVRQAADPIDVATVAAQTALPATTVRFHLDALERDGVIERVGRAPRGPGRPRLSYRARDRMDPSGPRNYEPLADALLAGLDAAGDPVTAARRAGAAWGGAAAPAASGDPVGDLQVILEDIGFSPVLDTTGADVEIKLRHCPFLELAQKRPATTCAVHLGLMQGALAAMRADVDVVKLDAFAAPGLCVARLGDNS